MAGVRCPYCTDGCVFRLMIRREVDFICATCGHVVFPDDAEYKCPCLKCQELERRLERAASALQRRQPPSWGSSWPNTYREK